METAPPQAATPRVHFLCADSGLGKTTALAEFARRATDAGQPTAGILCPLGEDGLRKMVCLRTGEERPLQMVPLTEADAAQRKERLDTTDARTRETMSSAAAEASAAEQGEHGVAVGPFVVDRRCFDWAQATVLHGGVAWGDVDGEQEALRDLAAERLRWLIIDEVGPLEMRRKEGLEPALSSFLSLRGALNPVYSDSSTAAVTFDVIVVVRPSLRDQIVGYLGLAEEMCVDVRWNLSAEGFVDPLSLTLTHSVGPPRGETQSEADWQEVLAAHSWGPPAADSGQGG